MTFFKIAWRNLLKRPRHSVVLTLAIASGMFALVAYLAMLDGFLQLMVSTLIDTSTGHIQVHHKNYLLNNEIDLTIPETAVVLEEADKNENITSFSPRVIGQGLASSAQDSNFAKIFGIDPILESNVTNILDKVTKGEIISADDERMILIGEALADKLQIDLGDKMVVMAHDKNGEMSGMAFRVKGMYKTSSKDFDRSHVYVPIKTAREMLALGGDESHEIAIRVEDADKMALTSDRLGNKVRDLADGDLIVQTWREIEPVMAQQVEMSQSYNYIMFMVVYIALAFGIINSFLMEIYDRIKEFGIMMSMGTRPSQVFEIIFFEALILGLAGPAVGVVLSFLIVTGLMGGNLDVSAFSEGMQYMGITDSLPLPITWEIIYQTYLGTTAAVIVAAIYPAIKAASFKPVEAIRHV